MTLFEFFLIGTAAGALLYIPVGPNGLLAFSSIHREGYKPVIGTGAGASSASFIMAFLSIMLALKFSPKFLNQEIIDLCAGAFLISMGFYFFYKSVIVPREKKNQASILKYFWAGLIVGITNPKNLIAFPVIVFTFVNRDTIHEAFETTLSLAAGACTASLLWWVIFYFLLKSTNIRKKPETIKKITRVLGVALIIAGSLRIVALYAGG